MRNEIIEKIKSYFEARGFEVENPDNGRVINIVDLRTYLSDGISIEEVNKCLSEFNMEGHIEHLGDGLSQSYLIKDSLFE